MTFTQAIKTCFSKYVDFSGRATRSEYWFWQLFLVVLCFVLVILSTAAHSPMVLLLGALGLILPSLAVEARRLRDGGFSPWLLLISLIPYVGIAVLVLCCMPSKGVTGVSTYNATVTTRSQNYCGSCGKLALPGQNYCQGCGAAL
jgi:uncharacterized membrane protein YhaH (DUF805 family)